MTPHPPITPRTEPLFPSATLFRSRPARGPSARVLRLGGPIPSHIRLEDSTAPGFPPRLLRHILEFIQTEESLRRGSMAANDQMTGAQIIIRALLDQGVDVVFGYPGGAVLPIYDELFKPNRLRPVQIGRASCRERVCK